MEKTQKIIVNTIGGAFSFFESNVRAFKSD